MTLRAPYLNDGDVRLYVGDCVEVMREMDADSVDAVVCDPPYGLEFMGKDWDSPRPSWDNRGQGAERGFAGKSRAPVAGFSAYMAGTPFQHWTEEWAREAYRVLKPGGHLLAFGGTRTFHRLTCGIEDTGFEIRDCLSWLYGSGFPKSLDVSKAIDKAAGAEREVVGERKLTGTARIVGGIRGAVNGTGAERYHGAEMRDTLPLTAPATDAAREWQGWGTALKPAWEPCVVARKPLVGTVAANVQQHGTGALNIDGCRIAASADDLDAMQGRSGARTSGGVFPSKGDGRAWEPTTQGRWPANVAFDEAAAAMLDAQSGERGGGFGVRGAGREPNTYGGGKGYAGTLAETGQQVGYGDTGGASRFFYTAKASRADRNAGGMADNTHPTVKPTDLMRWLVRLVTPPGGIVLDPFAGSGSTLVAARAEGVRAVGIERQDDYARIIADRLAQLSLFTEGME